MIIGTPIQGAKGVKTEVSRSSGDEHILHLSLRLKRASFIINILWGAAGEAAHRSPRGLHV